MDWFLVHREITPRGSIEKVDSHWGEEFHVWVESDHEDIGLVLCVTLWSTSFFQSFPFVIFCKRNSLRWIVNKSKKIMSVAMDGWEALLRGSVNLGHPCFLSSLPPGSRSSLRSPAVAACCAYVLPWAQGSGHPCVTSPTESAWASAQEAEWRPHAGLARLLLLTLAASPSPGAWAGPPVASARLRVALSSPAGQSQDPAACRGAGGRGSSLQRPGPLQSTDAPRHRTR